MPGSHRQPFFFLVAGLLTANSSSLGTGAETNRPNVVIIVSDDQGWNDIGFHNSEVKTPHIDRLVADGICLDRHYSYPICSMTRAALMTGLSTSRTGVNNSSGLDLAYHLLPQSFKAAGYQTWMFGKWHLGGPADNQRSGPQYLPHNRGFDYFYGHLHGAIDYVTHRRRDIDALDWQRNGVDVNEDGFTTDLLADDAVKKLKGRDTTKPVLLYLPFNAVHGGLNAPPSEPSLTKRDKRKLLLANVTYMDTAIGRVLKAIDDEGLRNDTLVLFFSDNGGDRQTGASNAPLRGEKGTAFEGGIRTTAVVRWPSILKPGMTSEQVISVIDWFPTLAAAAGIKALNERPFDGKNLWSNLRDGTITPPENLVIAQGPNLAVIHGPWKLVRSAEERDKRGMVDPMLFRIDDDPVEKSDVAAKHPDVVKDLLGRGKAMTDLTRKRP